MCFFFSECRLFLIFSKTCDLKLAIPLLFARKKDRGSHSPGHLGHQDGASQAPGQHHLGQHDQPGHQGGYRSQMRASRWSR